MRSLNSANTPAGCNNLSTASEDLTKNKPKKPDPSRLHRNIRPSSLSPATRNPALSSATSTTASSRASSPALLSPTSTPLRPVSPAPATAGRKPTVAQIRARTTNNPASTPTRRFVSGSSIGIGTGNTTTNTPTSRPKIAAAAGTSAATATATRTAATGPPTATGPRPRITATTTRSTVTVTTIGAGTTKTSNSHSTTTAANPTAAAAATANPNPSPNTTSSPQSPPATASNNTTTTTTTTTSTTDDNDAGTTAETSATSPQGSASARRQQPALSSSLRSPLRNRDQNVLNPSSRPANAARAKPSPTPSPTSSSAPASASASASASPTPTTMPPYDKGGSTTTRQPGMPSLTAKGMNRAPLTPKVAAKPASVVTPLGRRRNDNTNNNTQHPTLHAATGGGPKDDLTSPAPFLGNNITPRSGHRQTRVDSNNSTPNGTPNPDRTNDWDHQPTFQAEPVRRQVVTFSPVPSTVGNRPDADSKFFYASDAKPSAPPPQPKQPAAAPVAPQRASTFMYANGSAIDKNRPTSAGVGFTPMLAPSLAPSLSPTLAPTPEPPLQSKFFYANGAPNLAPGFRPSSAASGTGPTIAESRKKARNSAGSASGLSLVSRPMSPNKPIQAPVAPPLVKSNSQPQTRTQMTSPPPLAPSMHKRKISMDAVSQVASHVNSRPASHVGSDAAPTDAMIMSQFMASQSPTPSGVSSPTMASFFPNQPITIASILQAADELSESEGEEEEDDDDDDDSRDLDELHSPTRSNHGDPLNDMVKHARRERKVQDLEITNASLEAINRSLERQLRKQTAELRRYKRLSRSGRLSSAPTAPPAEVPSEPTTGLGIEGVLDLSDLSEEEEVAAGGEGGVEGEGDLEDLEDSMFESSELDETDSAKSDPERDTRRRKRDEKRLQLDLTKHRELLVDSQKINQSIKKCLNWTEELIKEGKKALEYKVQPSDVKLPPRVLQPSYLRDNEDEEERKDGASAPGSPVESPRSLTPNWSKEPQDRDSGIELPAEGS
ncbi:hypothetical protein CKAH01_16527 [Colletotrichum kahawae]|uniref:Uncharacterized protein n=1 Tax=Colletotrichum kahawae TaxID=34407 RepID=A0AAD9YGA7_COLKA|nr:hypothetical protein CKAH01_16527 [Colletotrichum kahawae]